VSGFSIFFILSIIGIGMITIISLYGNIEYDDLNIAAIYMLYAGFFPIFGKLIYFHLFAQFIDICWKHFRQSTNLPKQLWNFPIFIDKLHPRELSEWY